MAAVRAAILFAALSLAVLHLPKAEGSQDLSVTMYATYFEASVSSNVTLQCNVYETTFWMPVDVANVTWTKDGVSLGVTEDKSLEVTIDTAGDVNFTCTATDLNGNMATGHVSAEFYEEFSFDEWAEDFTVSLYASPFEAEVNSNVTLWCHAYQTGNWSEVVDIANITWKQNGVLLWVTYYENTTNVTSVTPGEVNFTCTVTDVYGNNATGFTTVEFYDEFIFEEGPENLTVAMSASPYEAEVNSNVSLWCHTYESGNWSEIINITFVMWTQDGFYLGVTQNNTINVTSVIPGEVNFTCTVTDFYGNNATGMLTVEFYDEFIFEEGPENLTVAMSASPYEAEVNSNVTLWCHAYESGNWSGVINITFVMWTQDGFPLGVTQNNTINVTSVTPGEVNFTCTVTDFYGNNATGMLTVEFYEEVIFEEGPENLTVAMSATPYEAFINENVTLECHAYESGNWSEVVDIANVMWTQDGFYLGVTQNNTINVTSVTPGEVNFTCTVTDFYGNNATGMLTVEFYEEVIFEEGPENLTVAMSATPYEAFINDNVTLECHAYESGNWSEVINITFVMWTQDGFYLGVTQNNTINVTSVTPGEVNFTCTVTDFYGNNATGMLTVEFYEEVIFEEGPENLTVAMSATPYEAFIYDNVTLECHAYESGNWSEVVDIANVMWTQDGLYLGVTQNNTINVTSVTPGEVNFTCTVTDFYGNNATGMLTVEFYEEVIFEEGPENLTVAMSATPYEAFIYDNVTLECHAYESGNWSEVVDIANVMWTQDGLYLGVTQNNTINVTSVTPGEVNFTCTVTDFYGNNATGMLTVEFYEEVIFEEGPENLTVTMSATPYEAFINENVTLECHAYESGNWSAVVDIANVMWTQDGFYLGVTQNNTINVTSVTPGEVNFTCTVTDFYGNNATGMLTVEFFEGVIFEEGPENLTVAMSATPFEAFVNDNVTLECHAYASGNWSAVVDIANVMWAQDGFYLGVTQNNKINVTSVTPGEVNFTCTVTDFYGNNATGMLTVEFYEEVIFEEGPGNLTVAMSATPYEAFINDNVTLECHAYESGNWSEAVDIANVMWTQDGASLGVTQNNTINVTSATPGEVNFTCTVTDLYGNNATGMVTVEFYEEVVFEDGPKNLTVVMSVLPFEAEVNSIVMLECSAYESGNWSQAVSIANVTWTQDSLPLGVTEDSKINVTSDTPGDVNITCLVTDFYGNSASETATVGFYALNETEGDFLSVTMYTAAWEPEVNLSVTLNCHAYIAYNWSDIASVVNVSWTQDGDLIAVTEDTKINVTSDTPGYVNFTCTVTDEEGNTATDMETVHFIALNETDDYEPVQAHISANTSNGALAAVETTVEIQCWDYLGQAPFTINWTKDGVEEFGQTGNYFYVSSSIEADVEVSCTVTDARNVSATSSFTVSFVGSLSELTASLIAIPGLAGVNTTVTLDCHTYVSGNWSDGADIVNVTWTQGGLYLAVTFDTELNVTSETPGYANFTCTATDYDGNTATSMTSVTFYAVNETEDYEPVQAHISANTSNGALAAVGTTIEIQCWDYLGQAPFTINWTKDGVEEFRQSGNYFYVSSSIEADVEVSCTVTDAQNVSATSSFTVSFIESLSELTASLIAIPGLAGVNTTVTLDCHTYVSGNWSDGADIVNVTWTQGGLYLAVTFDTELNVTSDTPGYANFTCTATDYDGNTATSMTSVAFYAVNETEDYQPVQAHISANTTGGAASTGATVEMQCWPHLGQAPFTINWTMDGVHQMGYTGNYFYLTSSTVANVEVSCTVTDGQDVNATSSFTVSFTQSPCVAGQGFSWVQNQCTACDGINEYNDGSRQVCAYCRYNTGRPDACLSTDGEKTSTIARKDVCISAVIWSETCNAASVSLTDVNTMLSTDARAYFLDAFNASSGLCANAACENIRVSVARRTHLCQALSCNSSSSACDNYSYKTTVSACLYDVKEFVDTGVENVYRRPQEIFLESVSNLAEFPSSSVRSTTFADGMHLVLPVTRVDITNIPEIENRVLVATFHTSLAWSSNYQSLTSAEYITLNSNIQEELPPMLGQSSDLLFVSVTSLQQYSGSGSNLLKADISLVFRTAISTTQVQTVAEIGVRAHTISGGEFGTTGFWFRDGIHVYDSASSQAVGNGSLSWCSYLETLSQRISLSYCEENTECQDTDVWFECLPEDDTQKQQRDLYPYGIAEGDSVLENSTQDGWYWYYHYISDKITFSTGAPFGTRRMNFAHVLPNGVITFGSPHRAWWPSFYYAQRYREQHILAPFWHSVDWRKSGKVYYQLYEKPGASGFVSSSSVDTWSAVLDRAETEVAETLGVTNFDATSALVATWVRMQPYTWWTWVCTNYYRYKDEYWWIRWYQRYYDEYCLNQHDPEVNTFQCVYVTDGQDAYVIVTYKAGEMRWRYDRWRSIEVGFTNPSETRDFGFRYTDLTTTLDTNTFNTGRYGTWIEKVGEYVNTDAQCFNFFIQNLYMIFNATHNALLDNLYKCPCNMERLGFQWTWYGWTEVSGFSSPTYRACYILGRKRSDPRIRDNPHNKMCCYYFSYPTEWTWNAWREARRNAYYIHYNDLNAGHVLKHEPYRPWSWGRTSEARLSKLEDFDPKNWCCRDSTLPSLYCYLFNLVRPDMGCSNDVDWFLGRAMGDPHISTLDSKRYTFNGKGEYTLMQVTSIDFTLQARTDQTTNSNGNLTLATVFVAFAAREGNNITFQVELNENKTRMVLSANGQDITNAFYANSSYVFENNDLTVERQDRNTSEAVSAAFPSNIALEVYIGVRNLEFTVTVPTSYKGETSGLMGNYNDDNTDEFVLPDGTALTSDQVDTERKVFENFGREWEVTSSSSIFQYAAGESALTYQFPNFEPLFREEANQTLLQEAEDTCGVEQDACIFDLLATGDQAFAEATKSSDEDTTNLVQSLGNNLPVLSLTTQLNAQSRWQLTHNEQATLQFSATDADGDAVGFELVEAAAGVSLDNETGLLTYTPDYSSPVVISVRASDGKGKSSTLSVNLVVCTGCSGNGTCDWSNTRQPEYENGKFLISACTCWPAYTGDDCDEDVDGCADDPCGEGLNCTDLTIAEQGNQTVGYICGDCPDGYTRDGASCVDTNECIENGTSPVCPDNADCENTIGSYSCSCSSGYRTDPSDDTQCKDIDECAEQTHDCDQVCENQPGNFSCNCYGGSTLNQDGKTCTSNGISCNVTCAHFCQQNDDGSTECNCRTGYVLAGDGAACNDLNECEGKTPCSQVCNNNGGGFTCSCYAGYQLSDDLVSCTECAASYWGVNCASQCQCNGHGTCDRTRGCVCDEGWSGTRCITDVNECAEEDSCPVGQECTNTLGSYRCSCTSGYSMNGDQCEDVDECADVLLHDCDLSTQDCVNNVGSFSCTCRDGYARNAENECADINECTQQSHSCEQVCENTEGSYNCDCYLGYALNSDRQTCVLRSDPCEGIDNLNCSQICTVNTDANTAYCLCNSGYGLVGTEDCQDIDECAYDNLNLCSYKLGCSNTLGGFDCSCTVGTYLDRDGRTCVACGSGTWGDNCGNSCQCDSDGASTCDAVIGCVCNTGFRGTYCEEDVDECTSGALTCPEGERCVNTRGSAHCDCLDGYSMVLGTCTDIDECAIITNNDCEQICVNFAGGYQCTCNAGYEMGDNCTDIDECTRGLAVCEQNCENSEGSYRCTCEDGLKLDVDGLSCIVASECTVRTDCQDRCAVVNDTETCFCPRGFELNIDGASCDDIDLCLSAPCEGFCAEVENGTSIMCSCDPGQALAGDGFSCIECVEGRYGVECVDECTCNTISTESCNKVNGSCTCLSGWEGTDCAQDIDECTLNTHNCTNKADSSCENTPGSFVCKCDDGYFTDNNLCSPCDAFKYGDECVSTCDCDREHSTGCDSLSGTCACESGWTGTRCDTDVDECAMANNCTQANRTLWVCENTPGSYVCQCEDGYQDVSNECIDIDECAADFSNLCNQNCSNTVGNYTCSCNAGYLLGADGRTCEDEDECATGSHGCEDNCINSVGSYTCSCGSNRELDNDNRNCYNAFTADSTVTLRDIDASGLNLREHLGADYINTAALVQPQLYSHFVQYSSGVTKCTITDLRAGSVIVDFTTVINTETTTNAESQLTDALIALATNGITINGTHTSVQIIVGSLTVTSSTDKCEIMAALNACGADQTCMISESGSAYCGTSSSSSGGDDIPLIVGLSVGLPLGLIAIAAIGAAVWYKKKYKGQKRVNDLNERYNEDDSDQRSSSPDSFQNFLIDKHRSSLVLVPEKPWPVCSEDEPGPSRRFPPMSKE